jgi:hypothetical protein
MIRKSALPISAGLLADTTRYYKALESYREGEPEHIIEVICDSAILALEASWETVSKIELLRDRWNEKINARKDSSVWRLLDILFEQPVITAAFVREKLGVSDLAARNTIETAAGAGIIEPIKNQKRNVMYICKESTKLLDDFSKRGARRAGAADAPPRRAPPTAGAGVIPLSSDSQTAGRQSPAGRRSAPPR